MSGSSESPKRSQTSLKSLYPEDLVGLEEPHVVELINDGGGASCCGLHGTARARSGAWAKSACAEWLRGVHEVEAHRDTERCGEACCKRATGG